MRRLTPSHVKEAEQKNKASFVQFVFPLKVDLYVFGAPAQIC